MFSLVPTEVVRTGETGLRLRLWLVLWNQMDISARQEFKKALCDFRSNLLTNDAFITRLEECLPHNDRTLVAVINRLQFDLENIFRVYRWSDLSKNEQHELSALLFRCSVFAGSNWVFHRGETVSSTIHWTWTQVVNTLKRNNPWPFDTEEQLKSEIAKQKIPGILD